MTKLLVIEPIQRYGEWTVQKIKGFLINETETHFTIQRETKAKTLKTFKKENVMLYEYVDGKAISFKF